MRETIGGAANTAQARNDALGKELEAELVLAYEALRRVRDLYTTVTD